MSIRIVVADDHPVVIAGAQEALAKVPGIQIIASATDSTSLVEALSDTPIDVAVTDFSMPGGQYGDGVALLGFLKRRFPKVPLVVLTGIGGTQVLTSLRRAELTCIVAKTDLIDHLVYAIQAAHRGQGYLSPDIERQIGSLGQAVSAELTKRETEVLRLIAEGRSQKEIAEQLQRSRQTISTQKHSAMRKLGLQRTADIFEYAVREGLVSASQASRPRRGEAD
ncbi:response regulator transcription factor [Stenotrophomonas maltophilia]|uniref:response regulator transcription factor n=1 Tax=Stenotrophomonas maltophilia TaxID=40324 RepID=UPI000DAAC886|nr:response regulator transcription factor [Stenotrophomonas maltophilia]PZS73313.1 DNA-binding response regulator [Stenotrophomonas maltophilia]